MWKLTCACILCIWFLCAAFGSKSRSVSLCLYLRYFTFVFSLWIFFFFFFLFVNFWRDSSAKNDSIIFLSVIHLQSWCYKLIRSFFRRLQWRFFEECPSLFFPFNECEWKTGSGLQIVKKKYRECSPYNLCTIFQSYWDMRGDLMISWCHVCAMKMPKIV